MTETVKVQQRVLKSSCITGSHLFERNKACKTCSSGSLGLLMNTNSAAWSQRRHVKSLTRTSPVAAPRTSKTALLKVFFSFQRSAMHLRSSYSGEQDVTLAKMTTHRNGYSECANSKTSMRLTTSRAFRTL